VTGPCNEGHFCPLGSTSGNQVKCPVGTFRSIKGGIDADSCGKCPSGSHCSTEGLVNPAPCTQGFYCARGTIKPEPCPVGTYGATTGLTDSVFCTPCKAGKYCWQAGLAADTDPVKSPDCYAGFQCIAGASRPEPTDLVTGRRCPAGSYCPAGIVTPTSCPAGTFNAYEGGKTEADDCAKCWPGYYCEGTSNGQPTGLCTAGYYCELGSDSPLPNGHANKPVNTAAGSKPAAKGHYAPAGASKQTQCPPGSYNALEG
jgi:hypothetical protein